MNQLDIVIAGLYFVAVIAIGIFNSKKNRNNDQLYLATNSISWFPLGISVMISAFSAVNFVAFPSEIIKFGPAVLISLPAFIIVLYPLFKWFIPFYRKQSGYCAYDFLEDKYDRSVKNLANVLFVVWRLMWIAVTLYASAKMLMVFTGFSLHIILLVTGITAIFYSSIGGFRAVVFTDLLQFFILFGTICLSLYLAVSSGYLSVDSFKGWFLAHPLPDNFFSFSPNVRITFWSGLTGTVIAFMARYGADQITVQRFMAAKTEKEAQKAALLNAGAALAILTLLLFWGITVALTSSKPSLPPLKQMAYFIQSMPTGVAGLFAAALLAAAMSSIDSGLNAMSAVLSDNIKMFSNVQKGKVGTFLLGILALFGAYALIPIMAKEGSIFVVANKIIHGFGAPILSLILLGMFSKRISAAGVFWGTITGAVCAVASVILFSNLAVHAYVIINLICSLAVSWLISKCYRKAG